MNIILIGDSGHARVIADNITSSGSRVVARLDDKYTEPFKEDGSWMGPVSEVYSLIEKEGAKVVIAIGSNSVRKKIVERLALDVEQYATVIHKDAIVSPSAVIGKGTVVMPGVIVNAAALIGSHVILNTRLVIEHDCVVGDYAHVSPGAMITGGVKIGEGVHIGAGTTVIPLKEIGRWSVVGAGAVVIDDIEEHSTAVGIPAKVIKTASASAKAVQ
ncbi:acetyltransferase [Planomicrobium sp. CPCC 101110]|uniref:acetyltransferase n=1 Tax=Planomicrobium sp. CPCC 101110 TaxID=2599619 RepID=UPI0011B459D4|nr:acetyltransferase [Planomicrobium sp. CPCC 101110]TWT27765.1 acetyltransferase [Planomicrobium sp. CPCC 101110]